MKQTIFRKSLCLILIVSCMTIGGQNTNGETFYRSYLLGKKWVFHKNDGKRNIYLTFVFDNDSVTTTFVTNNKTKQIRYAYYLSEQFPLSFEDSLVGNTTNGCWLVLNRYEFANGVKQRDGAEMKIFTLNDHEFSFGKSSNYQMVFTAEPLE